MALPAYPICRSDTEYGKDFAGDWVTAVQDDTTAALSLSDCRIPHSWVERV
jgi:hypothetical protein